MRLISQSATRAVGRKMLQLKKQSPHIFFAGGMVGIVTSTVLACRATLKVEDTLDEIKEDVEHVKGMGASIKDGDVTYTQQDNLRDLGYVYAKSAVKLGKLYGPSIAIGSLSVAALTGSHIQLARRNTALTVTLAAVSKAYEDYRVRVKEEIGEERELDIYRKAHEVEVQDEGQKKEIAKVVSDPNEWSVYARFFDEGSPHWQKDPELNRIFVQLQQNYANHILQSRGHLFLNEVYDMLGIERSQAGAVVGWVINGDGDNYVDFGMFLTRNTNFVNGYERSILLDFNVDGVVYDKI